MPRAKRILRQTASPTPIPSDDEHAGNDAGKSPKRRLASRDASPCPSSPPKRQMASTPEPEPAQQSNPELQMTSLQSKHEALEAEFAALKDRLTAVESRLPPSGNETAPVGPDDVRQPLESGHPAKGEDEPGCPDLNSSDQANDETIQSNPVDIFRSVGREPEQFRRWNDKFLFGWEAPVHFSENRWPDLGRWVTSFCQAAFPRHVPLDQIEKHDKDWMSSWAPNYEEYVRKYNGGEKIYTLYEACVWRLLHEELFSDQCVRKWREGSWADFGSVLRHLQPDVRRSDNQFTVAFHLWKRNSVRMLHMSDTRGHSDRERLKDTIYNRLRDMIDPGSAEQCELTERRFWAVVDSAIEVDLYMLASLQDISVNMADLKTGKSHGFIYEEASLSMAHTRPWFTGEPAHDGRPVAFIAAPLLQIHGQVPTGTTFGHGLIVDFLTGGYVHNYHVGEVMSPMRVVLEFTPEEKPRTPWLLGRPG